MARLQFQPIEAGLGGAARGRDELVRETAPCRFELISLGVCEMPGR